MAAHGRAEQGEEMEEEEEEEEEALALILVAAPPDGRGASRGWTRTTGILVRARESR